MGSSCGARSNGCCNYTHGRTKTEVARLAANIIHLKHVTGFTSLIFISRGKRQGGLLLDLDLNSVVYEGTLKLEG
jgi:hypothetical protein